MHRIIGLIVASLILASCAPVLVGTGVGVGVYRYQKCEKWVHTPYGDRKVWTCKNYISGD